jgi:hypothetical protein
MTRAFPASPLRKEYILGIALSEGGTKRLQKNDIYLSAEDQSGKSSQDNLFWLSTRVRIGCQVTKISLDKILLDSMSPL